MEALMVHRAASSAPSTPAAPSDAPAAPSDSTAALDEDAPDTAAAPSTQAPTTTTDPITDKPDSPEKGQNDNPVASLPASPMLELAPLPTEFNPDATPPPPLPPKLDEEDELAFEPHPDPEPEPELEPEVADTAYHHDNPELYESLAALTQFQDGEDATDMEVDEPEEAVEEVEQVEEVEEVEEIEEVEEPIEAVETVEVTEEEQLANGDPSAEGQAGEGAEATVNGESADVGEEGMDADDQTQEEEPVDEPMDSPLSDIPDLPQEIDFSQQPTKPPTPPPVKRKPPRATSEVDEGSASKKKKLAEPEEEVGVNGRPTRASAIRSRKRLDAQLNISRDMPQPLEKVAPRAKTLTDARIKQLIKGKTTERQLAPCLRPRYGVWGKCVQCVAKVGGDSCRFRETRIFDINPQTGDILKPGRFGDIDYKDPIKPLPTKFNTTLTEEHMRRVEETVAPVLLHPISQELRHIVKNKAIYRGTDAAEHRALCDFCASTIFGGYFFCKKCGRDYCLQCERYMSDTTDNLLTSPWPLPDAAKPRLHKCSRGGDETLPMDLAPGPRAAKVNFQHARCDLQAASRFHGDELKEQWRALLEFVLQPGADVEETIKALTLEGDEDLEKAVREWFENQPEPEKKKQPVSEEDIAKLYEASRTAPTEEDPAELETHPFMYIDANKLDHVTFDELWARGEPMVAYGTRDRFKGNWTPDMFIDRFGSDWCWVMDCQNEKFHESTIRSFFTMFKVLGHEQTSLSGVEAQELEDEEPPSSPEPLKKGKRRKQVDEVKKFLAALLKSRTQTSTPERDGDGTADPVSEQGGNSSTSIAPNGTSSKDPAAGDRNGSPAANDVSGDKCSEANGMRPSPAAESNRAADTTQQEVGVEEIAPEQAAETSAKKPSSPQHDEQTRSDGSKNAGTEVQAEGLQTVRSPQNSVPARKPKPVKILKLKDWPVTNDFEDSYPDMYHDFSNALPVPDYTRRDGVLNLYSHFPQGATRPDIGPKMYNAFAAREDKGGMGSTRLHMDVADAINIQLHASPTADGKPGCAVWDLFRAEDADKIRQFLMEKFDRVQYKYQDPIHAQMFYLDAPLRAELLQKYGVKSFRVYQYPGDAVFIPAGCAHQVCNLANCIKIALDFVSPHNVRRCQRLGQDFRQENFVRAWKDDVLQLYNVLWYAWTNVRETRERRKVEAAAQAAKAAERTAQFARWESGSIGTSGTRFGAATSSVRDETPVKTPTSKEQSKESTPAPAPAEKETPAGPSRDEVKHELVQRLLDAAIEREPMPVPVEEEKRAPTSPAPQLSRISQALGNNPQMMDMAMKVITGDMGRGMGDMEG